MLQSSITFPSNSAVVSRASSALYSVFSEFFRPGDRILFPANICYAAIFPAVYAGCVPVFCDVSPFSGNITIDSIIPALDKKPLAAVLPHMYGQPISRFSDIVNLLHDNGVLVIEDCASSMGATKDDGRIVGFDGDFTVYSTGYAKTVELGFGGILASDTNDVSFYNKYEAGMPPLTHAIEAQEQLFSKMYRCLRNSECNNAEFKSTLFSSFAEAFKPVFLHSIDEGKRGVVRSSLHKIDQVVARRRALFFQWSALFSENGLGGLVYPYDSGAVPWRFSFFVKPVSKREELISKLLDSSLPVSDWYPLISDSFYDSSVYPGASSMERSILNFPLSLDDNLRRSCLRVILDVLC